MIDGRHNQHLNVTLIFDAEHVSNGTRYGLQSYTHATHRCRWRV